MRTRSRKACVLVLAFSFLLLLLLLLLLLRLLLLLLLLLLPFFHAYIHLFVVILTNFSCLVKGSLFLQEVYFSSLSFSLSLSTSLRSEEHTSELQSHLN